MPDVSEPVLDDIQQDYHDEPAHDIAPITVPVHLDGPALVHELPAPTAVGRFVNTDLVEGREVLPADLRRKYCYVIATQNTYIGHSKQLVAQGEVAQLPAGVLLPLPTADAIWCRAVTVPGVLSYWAGQWAD